MSIYTPTDETNINATAQRKNSTIYMLVEGSDSTAVYEELGTGWTKFDENPGAQTKSKKYINSSDEVTKTTSYKRAFPFEVELMYNRPAIKKVYDISTLGKIGSDALVELILVDEFLPEVESKGYPARKIIAAVSVDSNTGEDDMVMSGNFNSQGDAIQGYFDTTAGTFTKAE